ncbi:hypothetical protein [Paenibacillus bovis]|uniref:Uncharacterized protein n=1 Tax=Paenibacillus bovis TaxID=1616788 RepID=A0A172ZJR1_9BACL|nr:hypothetical protein [Paenibacillus bovis]ANF97861.1 hypothetical protein AR543_18805 [Paenibacillus bovis]
MPEYSHIQTYIPCDEKSYKDILRSFISVLLKLNIDPAYFLDLLEGGVTNKDFMYKGSSTATQEYEYQEHTIHVRPYIMGWTPEVIPELTTNWMEISILLWTEEIDEMDNVTGEIKETYRSLLWQMMCALAEEFTQTDVYFTNEVTDGLPWEAIVTNQYENLYVFDAAIIPKWLQTVYKDLEEEEFMHTQTSDHLYIADKAVWKEAPWDLKK